MDTETSTSNLLLLQPYSYGFIEGSPICSKNVNLINLTTKIEWNSGFGGKIVPLTSE